MSSSKRMLPTGEAQPRRSESSTLGPGSLMSNTSTLSATSSTSTDSTDSVDSTDSIDSIRTQMPLPYHSMVIRDAYPRADPAPIVPQYPITYANGYASTGPNDPWATPDLSSGGQFPLKYQTPMTAYAEQNRGRASTLNPNSQPYVPHASVTLAERIENLRFGQGRFDLGQDIDVSYPREEDPVMGFGQDWGQQGRPQVFNSQNVGFGVNNASRLDVGGFASNSHNPQSYGDNSRGSYQNGPENIPRGSTQRRLDNDPRSNFQNLPQNYPRLDFQHAPEYRSGIYQSGPDNHARGNFQYGPANHLRGDFQYAPDNRPGIYQNGPDNHARGNFQAASENFSRGSQGEHNHQGLQQQNRNMGGPSVERAQQMIMEVPFAQQAQQSTGPMGAFNYHQSPNRFSAAPTLRSPAASSNLRSLHKIDGKRASMDPNKAAAARQSPAAGPNYNNRSADFPATGAYARDRAAYAQAGQGTPTRRGAKNNPQDDLFTVPGPAIRSLRHNPSKQHLTLTTPYTEGTVKIPIDGGIFGPGFVGSGAGGTMSKHLALLTQDGTVKPTIEQALNIHNFPFYETCRGVPPQNFGVVKIGNIPYNVSRAEIMAFLGRGARLVSEVFFEPVHIIMERVTSKTLDCYVEFESFDAAVSAVNKFEFNRDGGRVGRLGHRHVDIELSSQEILMKELFPKAKNVRWVGDRPQILPVQPDDHWNSGFLGFVMEEELVMMVKHVENPQRSPFSKDCGQRPFECLISTLLKYPWGATQYVTIAERNLLFEATQKMLWMLKGMLVDLQDSITLTPMLYKRVWKAALICKGFTPTMKDNIICIAEVDDHWCKEYKIPPFAADWKDLWCISPKLNIPRDVLQYYINVIREHTSIPYKNLSLSEKLSTGKDLDDMPMFGFLGEWIDYNGCLQRTLAEQASAELDGIERVLRKALMRALPFAGAPQGSRATDLGPDISRPASRSSQGQGSQHTPSRGPGPRPNRLRSASHGSVTQQQTSHKR